MEGKSSINVAIIAYGYAGRKIHAHLLARTPGLVIYGVMARSAELRNQAKIDHPSCKTFETFEEVLSDPDVHLVVLASPTSLHCDQAVRALRANKHVVTDKPMCRTVSECDLMLAAARDSGKMLSVFQNRRWDGDFLTVQQVLAEKQLGERVRFMELAFQRFGLSGKAWKNSSIEEGAGALLDLGAHTVDQLNRINQKPISTIYARILKDFPEAPGVDSNSIIFVNYVDGSTALLDISSIAANPKPRFHLSGPKATFTKYGLDPQELAMVAGDIDSARESPANSGTVTDGASKAVTVIPTLPGRWRNYYENVADHLLRGATLEVPASQIRKNVAVLEAAQLSALHNKVIPFAQVYGVTERQD
ncbi:hypothetical protein CAOG_05213 [Capsaspora owczarzaki ATCC 30864]|uniref:Oxidoreductase n=1 Tax=Capsaspora owczarzaki (strain ATCC 30864) TaxID=595528 RepID=A0A0D2VTK2_CAPO3|nr:hypothetical protein CAOG_05213 [Capsaspora owczarzaki ATCC 30864]KJE94587.1 hypothetical protein CAOG_005213 [Capsaspora owczarzaki ATCC 30864]|eukprot:XP_004346898.1 hypothetical protein CAOG_05213 [Capsaspora owczarzaki ATCC 30864]